MPRKKLTTVEAQAPRSERPATEAQLAKISELKAELEKPRRNRTGLKTLACRAELFEKISHINGVTRLYDRVVGGKEKAVEIHFCLALEALESPSMEDADALIKALFRKKEAPEPKPQKWARPAVNARRVGRI